MSFKTSTCDPDNPMRKNMEEIVGKVGLDFIVNVVLNGRMEVADAYAGHFIQAHRAACASAMKGLQTQLVENADITISSAYPNGTSGHNTGLLHSGILYPKGSLKNLCCLESGAEFEQVAEELDVPFRRCGKLIVGFGDEERKRLDALFQRGLDNGVKDIRMIDHDELKAIEPNADGDFAMSIHWWRASLWWCLPCLLQPVPPCSAQDMAGIRRWLRHRCC